MELKAKWPVAKGDEITAAHFEDLRKIIWAIGLFGNTWTMPATWSSNVTYTQIEGDNGPLWFDEVEYDGKVYALTNAFTSRGQRPDQGLPWTRAVRQTVYCDYARNSGCSVVRIVPILTNRTFLQICPA